MKKKPHYYSYNITFITEHAKISIFKLCNSECTDKPRLKPEYTVWILLSIDTRKVEYTFKYVTENYRDLKKWLKMMDSCYKK